MKQIILSSFFSFCILISYCQVDENVGKYFEFNENISLDKCNAIGGSLKESKIIIKGVQFTIDGAAKGAYIIHILRKGGDIAFNKDLYLSSFSQTTPVNSYPIFIFCCH